MSDDDSRGQGRLPGEMTTGQSVMHGTKTVLGGALKWGVIGAAAGAVALAAGATMLGLTAAGACGAAAVVTFGLSILVCGAIGYFTVGGALMGALTAGAIWGGLIGALLGGGMALSNVGESVANENEERVALAGRRMRHNQQLAALEEAHTREMHTTARMEEEMGAQNLPRGRGHHGHERTTTI